MSEPAGDNESVLRSGRLLRLNEDPQQEAAADRSPRPAKRPRRIQTGPHLEASEGADGNAYVINSLPDEILELIFRFVNEPILSCSSLQSGAALTCLDVCRKWRRVNQKVFELIDVAWRSDGFSTGRGRNVRHGFASKKAFKAFKGEAFISLECLHPAFNGTHAEWVGFVRHHERRIASALVPGAAAARLEQLTRGPLHTLHLTVYCAELDALPDFVDAHLPRDWSPRVLSLHLPLVRDPSPAVLKLGPALLGRAPGLEVLRLAYGPGIPLPVAIHALPAAEKLHTLGARLIFPQDTPGAASLGRFPSLRAVEHVDLGPLEGCEERLVLATLEALAARPVLCRSLALPSLAPDCERLRAALGAVFRPGALPGGPAGTRLLLRLSSLSDFGGSPLLSSVLRGDEQLLIASRPPPPASGDRFSQLALEAPRATLADAFALLQGTASSLRRLALYEVPFVEHGGTPEQACAVVEEFLGVLRSLPKLQELELALGYSSEGSYVRARWPVPALLPLLRGVAGDARLLRAARFRKINVTALSPCAGSDSDAKDAWRQLNALLVTVLRAEAAAAEAAAEAAAAEAPLQRLGLRVRRLAAQPRAEGLRA
eukprot:tig00000113_g5579.t1